MKLENIMLSEKSHIKKVIYFLYDLYKLSIIGKSIETENGLVVSRSCEEKGIGNVC